MAIYKYVTEERVDILQNGFIRFTQPSVFNDPFEVYPYFKAIANEEAIDDFMRKNWISGNLEKQIEEGCRKKLGLFSFALNIPSVKEKLKGEMGKLLPSGKLFMEGLLRLSSPEHRSLVLASMRKALDDTIGLLCLTEKPDNLLMWAHYTNLHRGFVIEFDEKHNFFERREKAGELRRYLKKVNYSEERPEIILFNLELSDHENMDLWINKFFWNKSIVWEYEQEWRIIETLKDCNNKIKNNNQEICLFLIPLECITGIILGCRMGEEMCQKLVVLLKSDKRYSHIKLKQAVIDDKDFKLNII